MTESLLAAHRVVAYLLLGGLLLGLVYGVVDYRRGRRLSRAYDRALWLLQGALLLQVALGSAVLLLVRGSGSPWHIALGSLAAVLLPLAWWPLRHRPRVSLDMGAVCGIALAAAAGALMTAAV